MRSNNRISANILPAVNKRGSQPAIGGGRRIDKVIILYPIENCKQNHQVLVEVLAMVSSFQVLLRMVQEESLGQFHTKTHHHHQLRLPNTKSSKTK